MATQYIQWEDTFTTTGVNASSVANGSTVAAGAISADQKWATYIVVEVDYGSTVNQAAELLIRAETGAGTHEQQEDRPQSFPIPAAASTTRKRGIKIPADSTPSFVPEIVNDTGAAITVTIRYKQGVLESV